MSAAAASAAGVPGVPGATGAPGAAADRTGRVLDAAFTCLARYGARRTTMEDIAAEMGVSRSAVYQYVANKDAAFRLLAERLHGQALDRARAAAAADVPAAERIRGILAAKLDLVLDLTAGSPHTGELLDSGARLFGASCADFGGRLRALLAGVLAAEGVEEPEDAADLALAMVAGLESGADPGRLFDRAVRVLAAGLGLETGGPAPSPAGAAAIPD